MAIAALVNNYRLNTINHIILPSPERVVTILCLVFTPSHIWLKLTPDAIDVAFFLSNNTSKLQICAGLLSLRSWNAFAPELCQMLVNKFLVPTCLPQTKKYEKKKTNNVPIFVSHTAHARYTTHIKRKKNFCIGAMER